MFIVQSVSAIASTLFQTFVPLEHSRTLGLWPVMSVLLDSTRMTLTSSSAFPALLDIIRILEDQHFAISVSLISIKIRQDRIFATNVQTFTTPT